MKTENWRLFQKLRPKLNKNTPTIKFYRPILHISTMFQENRFMNKFVFSRSLKPRNGYKLTDTSNKDTTHVL